MTTQTDQPSVWTYEATVPLVTSSVVAAGAVTNPPTIWYVQGGELQVHGDTYLILAMDGTVAAAFPLGTVVVRLDAVVPAPEAAT